MSRWCGCPRAWIVAALLAVGCGESRTVFTGPACGPEPGTPGVTLPADLDDRPLPAWYDDAKFGIMIHWGPFSVPAWAERTLDPEVIFTDPTSPDYFLTPAGVERFLRFNPYSEWYWNSIAIEGSAAQRHHAEAWGAEFGYERFAPLFAEESRAWRPREWADLFRRAGARYVVLVTKHHDGYLLWPSDVENPNRAGWNSPRDVVGELADAVRERCMRIGVYYSGGIDWTFTPPPFSTLEDALQLTPASPGYARYVDEQWRELVARYRPSILWNDIASPPSSDPEALFREYYAAVPDGVVNDRWGESQPGIHHDFTTAEFQVAPGIEDRKWEAVRGMARGFGYNRNDEPGDYGPPGKFVRLLVEVVSRNGNLLLNVGPRADGSIPDEQVAILEELGGWLARNGEAIHGTRPWTRFGATSAEGTEIRFTRSASGGTVYAILLGTPATGTVTIRGTGLSPAAARLLGSTAPLGFEIRGDALVIRLPAGLPEAPAHALALDVGD